MLLEQYILPKEISPFWTAETTINSTVFSRIESNSPKGWGIVRFWVYIVRLQPSHVIKKLCDNKLGWCIEP